MALSGLFRFIALGMDPNKRRTRGIQKDYREKKRRKEGTIYLSSDESTPEADAERERVKITPEDLELHFEMLRKEEAETKRSEMEKKQEEQAKTSEEEREERNRKGENTEVLGSMGESMGTRVEEKGSKMEKEQGEQAKTSEEEREERNRKGENTEVLGSMVESMGTRVEEKGSKMEKEQGEQGKRSEEEQAKEIKTGMDKSKTEREERKREKEKMVVLGSLLEEVSNSSNDQQAKQNSQPKQTQQRREHLKRKFEHADLDSFLDKDPLEKVYEKFISEEVGRGVFAKRSIDKNEFIAFYRGEAITEEEFNKKCEENDIEYVFYNQTWRTYIDGKNSTGIARLINDCGNGRRPNIVPRIHTDRQRKRHIKFIALTDIAKDEELVYNYGGSQLPWRTDNATKLPTLKQKPDSNAYSDTISMPELVKKPSTICTSEKNTSEMQTIPSSSIINWKTPKCDEEGHILIDFPLKIDKKRNQNNGKESDEEYRPNSRQTSTKNSSSKRKKVSKRDEPKRDEPKRDEPKRDEFQTETSKRKKVSTRPDESERAELNSLERRTESGIIAAKNSEPDPHGGLDGFCLYCQMPLNYIEEYVEHESFCTNSSFIGKPFMRGGKKLHFVVLCLHCSKVCNKHKFADLNHHLQTEHEQNSPTPGVDYIIYTICPEIPDEDASKTEPKTTTIRTSDVAEISRMRRRERLEREQERDSSSSSTENSSDIESSAVTKSQVGKKQNSTVEKGQLKCLFCEDKLSSYFTLKRHLKNSHRVSEPSVLNVIPKCHLLAKNENKSEYFLCRKCHLLCDKKFRHKYNSISMDHEPEWYEKPIISLKDLPGFILDHVVLEQNEYDPSESRFMKVGTGYKKVNFNKLLSEFEETKLQEIRDGTSHDWKMNNINGRIKRFREAIIATKGLQDASKLTTWISSYPEIRSANTRRNNLNLLKIFLSEFLCPAMAAKSELVNFPVFVGQLDNLMRKEQKSKKARHQLIKRATANMLPSKEQLTELKSAIMTYLHSKLNENVEELGANDFNTVIMNLVAMIILRNASRSGTITTMRTEYVEPENLTYAKDIDRVAMQFAPKSVITARKGPGERERLQKILQMLKQSHKNFFCDGIRYQVVKKSEMNLILTFKAIREKMGKSHVFLFASFDATENLTYDQQKAFCRRYHSTVTSQHGFKNMIFNSTVYRKLVTSEVCENISDPKKRLQVHEHIGHWEDTAHAHYNLERRKAENAAFTSGVIEQLIEREVQPAISSSQTLPITDQQEQMQSTSQLTHLSETDEKQNDDFHYDSDTSDGSEQIQQSDEDEENEEELTIDMVYGFLKTRKQRTSQQKYQLSDEDYKQCAKLFFQFQAKQSNFSQIFRDSGLPMNLDALKTMYKTVEKHFYGR